jgi:hypothetical protein
MAGLMNERVHDPYIVKVKITTGEPLRLEGVGYGQHSNPAAVSHNGTHVLVANETNSTTLCDSMTGETLMTFEGHSKRACRAAFASVLLPRKRISDDT